jgi:nitrite reductase (NADH) small subunit
MPLTRLASIPEMPPPGTVKEFAVGDKVICVANVDGILSAVDNACPHRGAPLGQGTIQRGKIVCPWHGWRWDPVHGEGLDGTELNARVYALEFSGDDVLVLL